MDTIFSRSGACACVAVLVCAFGLPRAAVAEVDIIFGGDFTSGTALQWVRRHSQPTAATIRLAPAFVTAVKVAAPNMTLNLQVPQGLNIESTYPFYSALKSFGPMSDPVPAVGDCVVAEGAISTFHGASEIVAASIAVAEAPACGAQAIIPYGGSILADIATDIDDVTADNQPGQYAEPLESVLVITEGIVQATNNGSGFFPLGQSATGVPFLRIGNFLYQYSSVQGDFVHVTGTLDQFDLFQLLPRSAADIVNEGQ